VPVTSATSGDKKSNPPVAQTRQPIFEFKSPYDYVLLGFMVVYLAIALYLRARTTFHETGFRASYALTISMGALAFIVNREEFAAPIRTTYVTRYPPGHNIDPSTACSRFGFQRRFTWLFSTATTIITPLGMSIANIRIGQILANICIDTFSPSLVSPSSLPWPSYSSPPCASSEFFRRTWHPWRSSLWL
jgi:hypothetical protein